MAKYSIALILVLVAHQSAGETPPLPSADIYAMYVSFLGRSPIGTDQFEEIKTVLHDDGFRQVSDDIWHYSDGDGIVAITTWPSILAYNVTFTSKKPAPFGDAALAALINRADSVFVQPGDSIQLLLSTHTRTEAGRSVELATYLSFELSGGNWWRTSCHIIWSE